MSSIHALVSGQLFADAETRYSASGKPFAKCAIALRDGDATTWVRLVAFGAVADELGALRKGNAVSAYLAKSGEPAASLEVVVDRLLPLTVPSKQRRADNPAPAAPPRVETGAPTGPLETWPSDL